MNKPVLPPPIIKKAPEVMIPVEDNITKPGISEQFASELRDFMNDFLEDDLGIDAYEEPTDISKSQANYYVKLYNEVVKEETELNELCEQEIERTKKAVEKFLEERMKAINHKKNYFAAILKEFARKELEGKKTKTVKLPYGSIGFKSQQPKIDYGDDAVLIGFIKDIGLQEKLVTEEVKLKLNKTQLKKECMIKDGMMFLGDVALPNVIVQQQEDKFEIK